MNNMFIEMISEAIAFSWTHCFKYWSNKRKLKKFRKNIISSSPTYGVLWQMADFIKYAEKIFFIPNNQKSILYSSRNYSHGQNGFILNDNGLKTTVKLIREERDKKTLLEIETLGGSSGKTLMTFVNNEWRSNPDELEEMMLDQAIDSINRNFINLFDQCYAKRLECISHET